MSTPDYQKQNEDFISNLAKLCGNHRGQRAGLRRWWSMGTRSHAYPVLGSLRAIDDERRTVVAALYAVHFKEDSPAHAPGGRSVGAAALKLGGGSDKADAFPSVERHFRRLLAADSLEDLAQQLHRFIKRFERESISLDYVRLLGDLRHFRTDPEAVKTRWSIHFWQPEAEPVTPSAEA